MIDSYQDFFEPLPVGGQTKVCAVTGIESPDCVKLEDMYILPSVKEQIQLGEELRDLQHFKTFEEYAGDTKLGILRMDVDGLGKRFIVGFRSIQEYKAFSKRLVSFFEEKGRNKDLVIYDCTSGYPVPFEDICLLELTKLRELYASRVKAIGFSGHHLGIAVDSAAVALGAEWVERHFTLDRTWKGTDHAASLEPDGVRKLARDCRAVAKALTYKREDILDIEKVQRNKLKKNQVKW